MSPRKRRKPAPADPSAQARQGIHIQASATVHQAEDSHVTGAEINAPDAQHIQIGDRVAGDKVLGDKVLGDKIVQHLPPTTPALHQLRAPVGDFVGRAAEIAQLVQAMRSGAVAAISGVRGMGGIGKTELAYVVAQQLAADFPDAQIVVELRGASDPISPVQALQTAIRAFEREARLPDDLAELQALYRTHLTGKRVLVLADDARDAAQVRPLLPPPGCALLVTSRYRFDLDGMTTLDLATLPPDQAIDLLRTLCSRITTEADAIARLCGYLPLALRAVAGLIKRTTRPVAEYIMLLEDTRTRLPRLRDPLANLDVAASLTLSYDALDPSAQHALCQLAVFVADFDRFAAEQIVTLPADQDLSDRLDLLHAVNLLDYDAALERYSLHDLVRVFVLERLAEADAVRERYARHYEQVARRADNLYIQGGESVLIGLALFDRERRHIDAGWTWARELPEDTAIDDLLIAYAGATAHIGDLRYGKRQERIPQLEAALAAAQRAGRRADQGWLLNNLGLAYASLGEVRRAIDFYEQDLAITREMGDRRGEGQTLNNLGNAYRNLGELRRAIECYEQSLVIKREVGDRRGEGNALGGLGNAYYSLGEVQQAIEYYEQQLTITRAIGDRAGEGRALGNLGNAYRNLGEVRRAIECYEQRLEIARAIGDRQGEALGSWNLGVLLEQQGDLAQAIALMQLRVDYELSIGHAAAETHAAQVEELRQQLQEAEGAAATEGDAPVEEPPPA